MELGNRIRLLRREHGLTQEQLAEDMGVSGAAVSKWENGQSVPELSLLLALAERFEVSVDCLLNHSVAPDALKNRLCSLQALIDARKIEEVKAQAETILRAYPNSYEAVEQCANAFYALFVYTGKRECMERAISLTKRLFALAKDEPETARYERLCFLGNQYELIQDYEQALRCYRASSSAQTERHIARCYLAMGQTEQATQMLSNTFLLDMNALFADTAALADCWLKQKKAANAADCTLWAARAFRSAGISQEQYLLLYTKSVEAYADDGQTDAAAKVAAEAMEQAESPEQLIPFLYPNTRDSTLSNFNMGELKRFFQSHLSGK